MLTVYSIPALKSNYFWLLRPNPESPRAYILDPGDAGPVASALQEHQLSLAGIIITHHHWDHTDGIDGLLRDHEVPVYGPDSPRIAQVTHRLADGDAVSLPDLRLKVLAVPGHTLDHLAYIYEAAGEPCKLFCGDALFAGGCGRMFEGQPSQMLNSLKRLAALPGDTQLYCSHEYTLANLRFAVSVEPDNTLLQKRLNDVMQLRNQHMSTLPSTIDMENRTNPFLRCHVPQIKTAAERHTGSHLATEADVFATLREWKDRD